MLTFPITGCIDRDQMLPDFRSNHSSTFWRTIYIVSMFVVFSYILFDVLDLDGSDFPRPRAPVERNVVVAEVPKDIKIAYCLDRTELWVEHSFVMKQCLSCARENQDFRILILLVLIGIE